MYTKLAEEDGVINTLIFQAFTLRNLRQSLKKKSVRQWHQQKFQVLPFLAEKQQEK